MDDRRKAYNQAKYAEQSKRTEMLRKFKELYPERYEALKAKLETEQQEAQVQVAERQEPFASVQDRPVSDNPYWYKTSAELLELLKRERTGKRMYLVSIATPRNGWVEEAKVPIIALTQDAILDELCKNPERGDDRNIIKIVSVEPCTCPLCRD